MRSRIGRVDTIMGGRVWTRRRHAARLRIAALLALSGALYRTLRTTNPIENLNGSIVHFARNVNCWKDGQKALRGVAGALRDAKKRLRKLRGHRDVETLLAALAASTIDSKRSERKAA
jgi:putative transposase